MRRKTMFAGNRKTLERRATRMNIKMQDSSDTKGESSEKLRTQSP